MEKWVGHLIDYQGKSANGLGVVAGEYRIGLKGRKSDTRLLTLWSTERNVSS